MKDLLFILIIVNSILIVLNASTKYQVIWLLIVQIIVAVLLIALSVWSFIKGSKRRNNN